MVIPLVLLAGSLLGAGLWLLLAAFLPARPSLAGGCPVSTARAASRAASPDSSRSAAVSAGTSFPYFRPTTRRLGLKRCWVNPAELSR